eukprot:323930-Rhodomonas_salina.1
MGAGFDTDTGLDILNVCFDSHSLLEPVVSREKLRLLEGNTRISKHGISCLLRRGLRLSVLSLRLCLTGLDHDGRLLVLGFKVRPRLRWSRHTVTVTVDRMSFLVPTDVAQTQALS